MNERPKPNQYDNGDIPSKESLQRKTAALIQRLDTGIRENTLDPHLVRSLKAGAPNTHDDLMLVYLGLKPVASMLCIETYGFNQAFYDAGHSIEEYQIHIPRKAEGGTNLHVLYDREFTDDILSVWNPQAARAVIQNNPDVFTRDYDPELPEFAYMLESFARRTTSPSEDRIYGLLLGMPKEAVELFAQHFDNLETLCQQLKQDAAKQGVKLFNKNSLMAKAGQVVFNENDAKNKAAAFIRKKGYEVDEKLFAYLQNCRPAEIPGFKYTTVGPLSKHEQQLTQAWQASGMDQGLEALLASYGV